MAFFVKIHGSNAITARAYGSDGTNLWASSDFVCVDVDGDPRAIFATKDEAHAAGLACRWNNQRYTVHVCRNDAGTLVSKQEWTSCQDSYGK